VVGGLTPAARNVISGNRVGIRVGDSTTTIVQGNLIGTNKLGTAPVPNENGFVSGGCNSGNATLQIGGATPEARNVVSGNVETGVSVGGRGAGCGAYTSVNSFIKGNYIGTDVTGTQPLGNGKGVNIDAGPDLYVGGAAAGEGNVIAFNSGAGITAYQGGVIHGIRILGNRIFGNGAMGIDLLHSGGVTPNDAGDTDEFHQNFPVITGVLASGGNTTVTGTLNSETGKTYRLEFFASDAADATSHGEGQSYLGTTDVTTDGGGDASFSVVLPATVTSAQFVTATATDPTATRRVLEARGRPVGHAPRCARPGRNDPGRHAHVDRDQRGDVGLPSGAVTLTHRPQTPRSSTAAAAPPRAAR
jgi:parallel beta-helix repeat protein